MKSLRKKTPNNGTIVVLIATEDEVTILIEALDVMAFTHGDEKAAAYGDLRVDLLQARYGNQK